MSTREVSWKEAADRKLSMLSEARVMPSSTGLPIGGAPAEADDPLVLLLELELVDLLADDEVRVADVADLELAEHLADDHADVLVVDVHALEPVHLLDLVHEPALELVLPLHLQDVVRVDGAVAERVARFHEVVVADREVLAERDEVLVLDAVFVLDDDKTLSLGDLRRT